MPCALHGLECIRSREGVSGARGADWRRPLSRSPPPAPSPQVSSQDPQAVTTFEHWPLRAADWLGEFNTESFSYGDFNETAYAHSIKVRERGEGRESR